MSLPKLPAQIRYKTLPIPALSQTETKAFLTASGIDPKKIQDLWSATHGIPAMLSSVARLHELGESRFSNLHSDLASYYDLEWDLVKTSGLTEKAIVERVFSLLVYSKKPLLLEDLHNYTGCNLIKLEKLLTVSGFVSISKSNEIKFSSNSHRDFLHAKLQEFRIEVLNKFVDNITTGSGKSDAIQLLPNYFEELGRDKEIVSLLTPDNLDQYLHQTQSLSALRRRNELGFEAAKRINEDVDVYRFCLQTSIVRSLDSDEANEARLSALATTGRLDDALNYALSQPTKEARLLLLSKYVRILYGRGLNVDEVLSETISTLIDEIDFVADKEKSVSIAENLIGPFPDLGIKIIENSSEGARYYQDIAFVHLVLKSQSASDASVKQSAEKYASKVSDSKLQGFLRATENVFKEKSADDIRKTTAGLDGKQRSFLLRQWIKTHPKDEKAVQISDYALDEVVRDPSYLPSAGDLMDICLPLADSNDFKSAKQVLERIEAQRMALPPATGTIDKFRLNIEIERARTSLGLVPYNDALSGLYVEASDASSNESKLECLCWLRSSIDSFENAPSDVASEFRETCDKAIHDATTVCLASTAEHLDVFKGAMLALVESSPDEVLDIVEKLNTSNRRDSAYSAFVEGLICRRSKIKISVSLIIKAISSIVATDVRASTIVNCLRLLAQKTPELTESPKKLIELAKDIEDPLGRIVSWRWSLLVSHSYSEVVDLQSATEEFLLATDDVDQVWRIPEQMYWFVESLSKIDKEFANLTLDDFERRLLNRRSVSRTYVTLLSELAKLTFISYCGLLNQKLDTVEALDSVFSVIDSVPSLRIKVDLYTDFSLRVLAKGRNDLHSSICEKKLSKLINTPGLPSYLRERLSLIAFVGLYMWNAPFAQALIEKLDQEEGDRCKRDIVNFFAMGISIYEPYEDNQYRKSRLTYPNALICVTLIESMKTDVHIAQSIEILCWAGTSKNSCNEITSHQRAELAHRLKKKAETDLPDHLNIKHDGWKITALAYCLMLKNEGAASVWKALIDNAKKIPNTSDSVFVLTTIAACLPKKLVSDRNEVLKEAEARLGNISSIIDRVRRCIALSNSTFSVDTEQLIAKRILTNAMKDSLYLRDQDAACDVQKQIIDSAYGVDKDFAIELSKMIDDDPARIRAKEQANQHIQTQKCKRALAEKKVSEIDLSIDDIGEISWDMLSRLNAGKVSALNQNDLSGLFKSAFKKGLFDTVGFYQFYLRNLQEKYQNIPTQASSVLLPLFEVTRLATFLVEKIGQRVCGCAQLNGVSINWSNNSNFMATPGGRDDSIEFIKNWLTPLAGDEVIICDPYFKIDDIEFIKTISFHKDGLSFVILSCSDEIPSEGSLEVEYRAAWSRIAFVEPPPLTAVHINYVKEPGENRAKHPIHDRWIICVDKALRIGTSIGSLGLSKLSEISVLTENEVSNIKSALNPFISMQERWLDGKKLRYSVARW